MDLGELTDAQLVAELRRPGGERDAIVDVLFSRHYRSVARWSLRFTRDRASAADLAQEVFLKAYRYLDTFEGTAQFSTWLYSILRNEAATRFRSLEPPMESTAVLADLAALQPGPDELVERADRAERLRSFLSASLDRTERVVFTLHYGDQVPLDTITRLLRLTNASGAKAYIVSARRKLARAARRLTARGEEV